jgi:hypothetical protein
MMADRGTRDGAREYRHFSYGNSVAVEKQFRKYGSLRFSEYDFLKSPY